MDMTSMKKAFLFLVVVVAVTGCASTEPRNDLMIDGKTVTFGACEVKDPTVRTTSEVHMIVEYLAKDHATAQKLAMAWCNDRGLSPVEEQKRCNGCCLSTFQCR